MSKTAMKIKKLYDKGIWTKEMVKNTVGKRPGVTEDEYFLITGEEYAENEA